MKRPLRHHRHAGAMAIAAMVAMALVPCGCRLPWQTTENANITPAARYIAGYSLLTTGPVSHDPKKQARLHRELEVAAGTTASGAIACLAALRNDPVAGKRLYDTIQSVITLPRDTALNHK